MILERIEQMLDLCDVDIYAERIGDTLAYEKIYIKLEDIIRELKRFMPATLRNEIQNTLVKNIDALIKATPEFRVVFEERKTENQNKIFDQWFEGDPKYAGRTFYITRDGVGILLISMTTYELSVEWMNALKRVVVKYIEAFNYLDSSLANQYRNDDVSKQVVVPTPSVQKGIIQKEVPQPAEEKTEEPETTTPDPIQIDFNKSYTPKEIAASVMTYAKSHGVTDFYASSTNINDYLERKGYIEYNAKLKRKIPVPGNPVTRDNTIVDDNGNFHKSGIKIIGNYAWTLILDIRKFIDDGKYVEENFLRPGDKRRTPTVRHMKSDQQKIDEELDEFFNGKDAHAFNVVKDGDVQNAGAIQ